MNNLYDNGTMVLGEVKKVKEYLIKYSEDEDLGVKDILKDLEDLEEDIIVAINYDCGMGYSFDYWEKEDIIKEC